MGVPVRSSSGDTDDALCVDGRLSSVEDTSLKRVLTVRSLEFRRLWIRVVEEILEEKEEDERRRQAEGRVVAVVREGRGPVGVSWEYNIKLKLNKLQCKASDEY